MDEDKDIEGEYSDEDYIYDIQDVAKQMRKYPDVFSEAVRQLKNPKFGMMDFSLEKRPYLIPIYREFGPDKNNRTVVLYCGRKVEKTETINNIILYAETIFDGLVAVYTAGKQEQVSRFVKERLKDSINQSKMGFMQSIFNGGTPTMLRFKSDIPNIDNILYSYSAWSEGNALLGIAGDLVCIDETQDIQEGFFEKIKEIIKRSPIKWMLISGTARLSDDEFHRIWKKTDMKEWTVKCPICGRKQILGDENIMSKDSYDSNGHYSEDVTIKTAFIGCKFCKSELDRLNGKWEATNSASSISGYHLNQLMVDDISPNEIMDCKLHYNRRKYYNEVLGMPYEGKSRPLSINTILSKCDNYKMWIDDVIPENAETYAGIDWGNEDTICIIDKSGKVVHAQKIDTGAESDEIGTILNLFDKFHVKYLVADFGYGARQIKDLQLLKDDQVRSLQYVNSVREPIRYEEWDNDGNMIYRYFVDKSFIIENTLKIFYDISDLKIPYSKDYPRLEWAINEMHNLKALTRDEGSKSSRIRYERYGDDHFFHALLYAWFARTEVIESNVGIYEIK